MRKKVVSFLSGRSEKLNSRARGREQLGRRPSANLGMDCCHFLKEMLARLRAPERDREARRAGNDSNTSVNANLNWCPQQHHVKERGFIFLVAASKATKLELFTRL